MFRLLQGCIGIIFLVLIVSGLAPPARATVCGDVIFKACLLDSLAQINEQATNVDDEASNDFIIRLNATLILSLLGGNPDAGIALLSKMDDVQTRDYFSIAAVRALEIDGQVIKADAVLSRITNPADHASAQAYRALVRADYAAALNPALIALKYGEVGPIVGVIELTPPPQTNMPCDKEPDVNRRCLAYFVRQAVKDENDASVAGLGKAIASAIEGNGAAVARTIRSFSEPQVKATIARGAQRVFAVLGKAKLANSLVKYTGGDDPTYALDKAIWANDMPAAFSAMKAAIQDGSLQAFLDLYQDVPAFPKEVLPN